MARAWTEPASLTTLYIAGYIVFLTDLVGTVRGRLEPVVMIEAKFWAGLTGNQPVSYLHRLPDDGGILLFIAPAARIETLWSVLRNRAPNWKMPDEATRTGRKFCCHCGKVMALVSWRECLTRIQDALLVAGKDDLAADVRQLDGLCERMDTEAFLPLRLEELTADTGRRILQFGGLVDDLVAALTEKYSFVSTKGLRPTAGNGWYGRYFTIKGHGCCLLFQAKNWADWGISPLWLVIKGPDWKECPEVYTILKSEGLQLYPKEPSSEGKRVPLPIPAGVEREEIFASLLGQLEMIATHINEVSPRDNEVKGIPQEDCILENSI